MLYPVADIPQNWRDRIAAGLDLLFPPTCAFCRQVCLEKPLFPGICRSCLCQLPLRPIASSVFDWCDLATGAIPDAGKIHCAAYYQGPLRQALLRMKFGDAPDLAPALASLLIQTIGRQNLVCRAVMAVPLHRNRLRERGYNQAGLLAEQISSRLAIPDWSAGLRRIRSTSRQSDQPDRSERLANLVNAFRLAEDFGNNNASPADPCGSRPILLVDDILTTGVTLTEAARPLWQAGLPVIGLVVASDHRTGETSVRNNRQHM